jgi:hypothetical protein
MEMVTKFAVVKLSISIPSLLRLNPHKEHLLSLITCQYTTNNATKNPI